jgi:hypothetical protein
MIINRAIFQYLSITSVVVSACGSIVGSGAGSCGSLFSVGLATAGTAIATGGAEASDFRAGFFLSEPPRLGLLARLAESLPLLSSPAFAPNSSSDASRTIAGVTRFFVGAALRGAGNGIDSSSASAPSSLSFRTRPGFCTLERRNDGGGADTVCCACPAAGAGEGPRRDGAIDAARAGFRPRAGSGSGLLRADDDSDSSLDDELSTFAWAAGFIRFIVTGERRDGDTSLDSEDFASDLRFAFAAFLLGAGDACRVFFARTGLADLLCARCFMIVSPKSFCLMLSGALFIPRRYYRPAIRFR